MAKPIPTRLEKRLVLIRHAHRDKAQGGDADNGLSRKGKLQAQKIVRLYGRAFPRSFKPRLLSSPKLRCIETLEPLAKKRKWKLEIDPLLDEGGRLEERVEQFIRWWKAQGEGLTVICSHGDWLPLCLERLTGVPVDMNKGGWAEVALTVWTGPGES